jgi:F0F1-type ATP synthase membrane subunit b/b'
MTVKMMAKLCLQLLYQRLRFLNNVKISMQYRSLVYCLLVAILYRLKWKPLTDVVDVKTTK